MVLWEPVLDPSSYLHALLRVTIATEMVAFGKVTRDRKELIESARGGELISVNGFNLSGAFVDELLSLDVLSTASAWGKGKVVSFGSGMVPPAWTSLAAWQFTKVAPSPFWREPKVYDVMPPALLAPTLSWLDQNR